MALQFETTFGQVPSGNWITGAAYAIRTALQQNLLDEPLLGAGRDPLAPARGAKDVSGPIEVPVDERLFGYWLKLLLGAPVSSAAIGARGYIEFTTQPAADTTITLNGVAWTLKSSGAIGNQTNIGVNLVATLDALVTDLNASADVEVAKCTYSRLGERLVISHDTATAAGDTYTLATTVAGASVSAATLKGGGLIRHTYHSASASLPSLSLETYHADWAGGSDRYRVLRGLKAGSLAISLSRDGTPRAVVELVGRDQVLGTATAAGTPSTPTVTLLNQFHGQLLVDGVKAANISEANFTVSNNLDPVAFVGDGGLIGGIDPGQTAVRLDMTGRFSNNALRIASEAETAVEARVGFRNLLTGTEVLFILHELHLPRPRVEIAGPGGIDVAYEGIAAKNTSAGRLMTVELYNDVAGYA